MEDCSDPALNHKIKFWHQKKRNPEKTIREHNFHAFKTAVYFSSEMLMAGQVNIIGQAKKKKKEEEKQQHSFNLFYVWI